tara:strand:+ start:6583 stop:7323 length:741 start_codon:yes stop_codon:yes gene_type:complete
LALYLNGYDQFGAVATTGEGYFVQLLSRFGVRTCVDVGANFGEYSRLLLDNTSADVIAFEPLPQAFRVLREVEAKFPGRYTPINMGVGDRSGQLDLYFGPGNLELASFSQEVNNIGYVARRNVDSISASVTTLDDYFFSGDTSSIGSIDLIKIDTEGYEYEVLVGASKTLARFKPKFVQVEFNWHQLFKGQSMYSISGLLPGYKLYQMLPYNAGMVERDPKSPEASIYHFSNFVFVRFDVAKLLPG